MRRIVENISKGGRQPRVDQVGGDVEHAKSVTISVHVVFVLPRNRVCGAVLGTVHIRLSQICPKRRTNDRVRLHHGGRAHRT